MTQSDRNNNSLAPIIERHLEHNRNYLLDRSASGELIVAYLCNYIPPDLITAVGAVPFRIQHGGGIEAEIRGARWLKSDSCSFCKACLGSFPSPGFPKPVVIVGASPCDQMRRSLEHLNRNHDTDIILLHAPRTVGKSSTTRFFRDELERCAVALADRTGVSDWRERLKYIIGKRKLIQQRLSSIDRRRGRFPPSLTGREATMLALAANRLSIYQLEQLVDEVEHILDERHPPVSERNTRVLLIGSIFTENDIDLFDIIEAPGSSIVADAFCTGLGANSEYKSESSDPLYDLADMLVNNGTCPTLHPNDRLYDRLHRLIEERHVDAALLITLKFCHPWSFEAARFRRTLKVPLLHLDRDYSRTNDAQWRTRYEAFLEMLELRRRGVLA